MSEIKRFEVPDTHVPILRAMGWTTILEGKVTVFLEHLDLEFADEDGVPVVCIKERQ